MKTWLYLTCAPPPLVVPFAPVSLVGELPLFLLTSPSFAPKSVKELVAYASSGNGGSPHLSAEVFSTMAGHVNIRAVQSLDRRGFEARYQGD